MEARHPGGPCVIRRTVCMLVRRHVLECLSPNGQESCSSRVRETSLNARQLRKHGEHCRSIFLRFPMFQVLVGTEIRPRVAGGLWTRTDRFWDAVLRSRR
jgi:hypothetical protein